MRVRVCYTVEIAESDSKALAAYHGEPMRRDDIRCELASVGQLGLAEQIEEGKMRLRVEGGSDAI